MEKSFDGLVQTFQTLYDKRQNGTIEVDSKVIEQMLVVFKQSGTLSMGGKEMVVIDPSSLLDILPTKTRKTSSSSDEVGTGEMAEYFGVTPETIRDWIKKGVIPASRPYEGARYRVLRSDFEAMKKDEKEAADFADDILSEVLGEAEGEGA